LKKKEAKYVPSNDKSEKQEEKFKDFDDEDNAIFLTPAIRVDVKTKTYQEEVFKPREAPDYPGTMKVTREREVKSITRDDEKNYFGLTFKEKVKEIKDGKINFVRTLDGKEVQKETYRKYDESQYNKIQQRYKSLIDDDRNLSEEQIKSIMEGFVNQIFFNQLDTLPTDTESRKRIKEAQDKMKDSVEPQKIPKTKESKKIQTIKRIRQEAAKENRDLTPEEMSEIKRLESGDSKADESEIMIYASKIVGILTAYTNKPMNQREVTPKIYDMIRDSNSIYQKIPQSDKILDTLNMFSTKTIDNFSDFKQLGRKLKRKKKTKTGLVGKEVAIASLLGSLSNRYVGGTGYELIEEMHSEIPEFSRADVSDAFREKILTTMKPAKLSMDRLLANLDKLRDFKYSDNEAGTNSLKALNEEIKSDTDSLEASEEFSDLEEIKRKLKREMATLDRLNSPSSTYQRYLRNYRRNAPSVKRIKEKAEREGRKLNDEERSEVKRLESSYIGPEDERVKVAGIDYSKTQLEQDEKDEKTARAKINSLRDKISELEPTVKQSMKNIESNKKKLLGFKQQILGVMEGITDYLDVLEEEEKLDTSTAKDYGKVLNAYSMVARELDLYVDEDVEEYIELLDPVTISDADEYMRMVVEARLAGGKDE